MPIKIAKAYDKPLKIPYNDDGSPGAEQCHKKECDINNIVSKFQKTRTIEHQTRYQARYDDMTGEDFQTAMNLVTAAQNMYEDLPSHIRKLTNNDPAQFFEFVQNPANADKLVELGLADRSDLPITAPLTPRIDTTDMEPESITPTAEQKIS